MPHTVRVGRVLVMCPGGTSFSLGAEIMLHRQTTRIGIDLGVHPVVLTNFSVNVLGPSMPATWLFMKLPPRNGSVGREMWNSLYFLTLFWEFLANR